MKYTIEIPDELNKYMVEGGWDVQAYIKQVLLDPLIKRFENEKKTTILSEKLAEVDAQVKDIHTKAEVKDFAVEKAEIVAETTASVTEELKVVPVVEVEKVTEPIATPIIQTTIKK
jgi:hypothetical protein